MAIRANMTRTIIGIWLTFYTHGISSNLLWMNIASMGSVSLEKNSSACSHITGFVLLQRQICRSKPLVVPPIQKGVIVAMNECKRQLSKERWDCSKMIEPTTLRGLLSIPSKETAFVYALTSAAISHAVTKSCSAGELPDCSCQSKSNYAPNSNRREEWKRRGKCDEDFEYGMFFSELFVDAPDVARRKRVRFRRRGRNFVNLHNSKAGREIIQQSVKNRCRCHGNSNACVVRTCWKVLPSKFSAIGNVLKKRYEKAVEVKYARKKGKLRRKYNKRQKIHSTELVYMQASPNYCRPNPKFGISGTSGRVCQRKVENSMNSCSILCCGQGYNTRIIREKERCKCRFIWCCYVKCQSCESVYESYTCK